MVVGPSTGMWLTYQGLYFGKKDKRQKKQTNKKTNLNSSPRAISYPNLISCEVESINPFLIHARMLTWSLADLLQEIKLLWVHEFSALMSRRQCFTLVFHDLWLLESLHSLSAMIPATPLGREMNVPFVAEPSTANYSLYLDQLWGVFVNHYLLNRETSLVKSKSFTNLSVQSYVYLIE